MPTDDAAQRLYYPETDVGVRRLGPNHSLSRLHQLVADNVDHHSVLCHEHTYNFVSRIL